MSIFSNPLLDAVFFIILGSLLFLVLFVTISFILVKFPEIKDFNFNIKNRENRKKKLKNKSIECLKCGEKVDTQRIYCSNCNRDFLIRKYYPYNLY